MSDVSLLFGMLDESEEYAKACLAWWCHTSINQEEISFFMWSDFVQSAEVEN